MFNKIIDSLSQPPKSFQNLQFHHQNMNYACQMLVRICNSKSKPHATKYWIALQFQAKFKLSQNRNPIDKAGVIEGLAQREDEMSRKIRALMMEHDS